MKKKKLLTLKEVYKRAMREVEESLWSKMSEDDLEKRVDNFIKLNELDPEEPVDDTRYIVCSLDPSLQEYEIASFEELSDVESFIRGAGCQTVVFLDGEIIEYGFYEGVTWVDPLYTIDYEIGGVKEKIDIHRRYLEEVAIKRLIKQGATEIKVYNHHNQTYDDFYVTGTIYSTQDIQSELIVQWGEQEARQEETDDYEANEERCRFFLEIADEDEDEKENMENITDENE